MKLPTALLFTASVSVFQAFSQNYYVSNSGNDLNAGTDIAPWEHVQFSLDQLAPGDTLNVMAGEYNEKVVIPTSGTANARITVRNHANDEPILDGTGAGNLVPMLRISSKNHITIDGLTIRDNEMLDAQGILVDGGSDGIIIQNCTIYNINYSINPGTQVTQNENAQPLIVYGTLGSDAISNIQILNNEIKQCWTGFSEGLAINGNVDGFLVNGNSVHDITNIGIDIIGHEGTSPNTNTDQARNGLVTDNTVFNCVSEMATAAGIYVDGGKDLIIERNLVYNNGYGVEVGCENVGKTTENIIVRNNLIMLNKVAGLALGGFDYPSGSGKVINCEVRNNTFFQNDFTATYNGELYLSYAENCSINSNIFRINNRNTLAYAELTQPGLTMNHNLIFCPAGANGLEVSWNGAFYFGFSSFQSGTGYESANLFGNPLFVTAGPSGTEEFHLDANSPAIDSADPTLVPVVGETDFYGNIREIGSGVDCGAVEFNSNSVSIADENREVGYFNPTTKELHIDESLLDKTYQLYSVEGKRIQQGVLNSLRHSFQHLSLGVFILSVEEHLGVRLIIVK